LGVPTREVWEQSVLLDDPKEQTLIREFSRLLDLGRKEMNVEGDLSLMGIQWRESFEVQNIVMSSVQVFELANQFVQMGLALKDEFSLHDQQFDVGELLNYTAFTAVADTVNVGVLSRSVRSFVEEMAYPEDLCYNTDLVVSEALTNVMLYGFKNTRPEPLQLTVLAFHHGVGVLIEDQGSRIPSKVLGRMQHEHSFQDDLTLGDLPEGGMGLAFMRMVSKRFLYQAGQNQQRNRLLMLL
jgi:anti-sigma regulatory factor (Ser/Thr protein kinase)